MDLNQLQLLRFQLTVKMEEHAVVYLIIHTTYINVLNVSRLKGKLV